MAYAMAWRMRSTAPVLVRTQMGYFPQELKAMPFLLKGIYRGISLAVNLNVPYLNFNGLLCS